MQIVKTAEEFKAIRKSIADTQSIGFVPTMGNLHDGHASLLAKAKLENTLTVLSIFINPTQFNNPEDFKHYPKSLDHDITLAEALNTDYLFLPNNRDIYPDNYNYKITESELSRILEGKFRPGHFEGVLTIVLKLLLITKPTRAYFGEKDYQQFILVKNMAQAFFLDTQIIGCETIRNENKLPLSSRNNRFTAEQFEKVQNFPKIFHDNLSPEEITAELMKAGFEVEYIQDYHSRRFAAVKFGGIRLIDNVEITS